MNATLKVIEDELARQDEQLAHFRHTLESLGDVELRIPQHVLDELEEVTISPTHTNATPMFGIRA